MLFKEGTKVMLKDQNRFPEYFTKGKVFTVALISGELRVRSDIRIGTLYATSEYFKLANIIYLGGE